jgi:hypothetical protein|tara:strand:+ start:543 stop:1346 length:804 start_codon:yes stop_codon:yes gene_type:complete
MTTQSPDTFQKIKAPGCFSYDKVNRVNKPIREQILPGSLVYDIVNAKHKPKPERQPFYVQNKKDYLESLERNCKKLGVPFKKPYVEQIPTPEKINVYKESHIEHLDTIYMKLNVLKNGKVRVKLLHEMAHLNEIYYSKSKQPPIKILSSTLKKIGYSTEFIDSMNDKYKKRHKLVDVKWKKLEQFFDAPSSSSINRKKKKERAIEKEKERVIEKEKEMEVEEDEDEDLEEEKKDDDEPEEDEAIIVDEEGDEEEVVEDDYVSDGGDD